MNLNLKRPLFFFDLETTGIDITKDRIVEISYIKVYPNGNEESKVMRVNPEMHIPEASTAVHHITDEDVKDCPTFKQIARSIEDALEGCDVAGFNSNHFDVPMLAQEFLRVGINFDFSHRKFVDVQNIYHKLEKRTLTAAYKFYCGKNLEDAHSALGDTKATYEVLKAQLDHYPGELKNDVDFLADYSRMNRNFDLAGRMVYNDKDEVVFNFGKHKGVPVMEVLRKEPGYFSWMLQGDFPLETKQRLTQLRLKAQMGAR